MCIPRKINFLQLRRYGRCSEGRSHTSRNDFDWLCFNVNRAVDRFRHGLEILGITVVNADIKDAIMCRVDTQCHRT